MHSTHVYLCVYLPYIYYHFNSFFFVIYVHMPLLHVYNVFLSSVPFFIFIFSRKLVENILKKNYTCIQIFLAKNCKNLRNTLYTCNTNIHAFMYIYYKQTVIYLLLLFKTIFYIHFIDF